MASWRMVAAGLVLALGGCSHQGEWAECGPNCAAPPQGYAQPADVQAPYAPPPPSAYPAPTGTLSWPGRTTPAYDDGPAYAPQPAYPAQPTPGPVPAYRAQPTYAPPPAYGAQPAYAASGSGRYANWQPDDYLYRVEPGDELALRFVSNPDMNGPVTIGPDGRGVFPLVSGVRVAELTAEQVNVELTRAYGQILRHPEVEVLVSNYGAAQVYVSGEVKEPGVKPMKGRLTAAQALAMAGGLATTARTNQIAVVRVRPQGRTLVKVLNLKTMTGVDGDFAILPGDMIFVPRSKIAEVDLFVEQYIKGVLPFNTSVGYNINPTNSAPF